MNLLIVSNKELAQKAVYSLDQSQWKVIVPALYSETWLGSTNEVVVSTIKQYLPRFTGIYIEEGMRLDSITLLQHAIEVLGIREYTLCDFESINDIAVSIENGYFVDENHANAKHAEYVINALFINRLSKGIKTSVIEQRIQTHKRNFPKASHEEISRMSKTWHKQLQNFYVLLPTIAGLYWIVKAERTILSHDPKVIHRIYVQYKKDGVEFTVPFSTVYTDEFLQECNDTVEYLRSPENVHRVYYYQHEERDVKPTYRPVVLSFLQSKMFYLYNFSIEYTTKIAKRLFHTGLITDPATSSYRVPGETSIALIRYLNQKYGHEYVLQHERDFGADDDSLTTAILPTRFEEAYDPENVDQTPEFIRIRFDSPKMKQDALTMYAFIYAITEWTQMKDAIYDSSVLQIKAGTKKLEVKANHLVDIFDTEKRKFIPQKCWKSVNTDLLNALNAGDGEISEEGYAVVLPKCNHNETLYPTNINYSSTTPKRPPRYGVGRFNTQILGGKGIGTAESFHIIQNNLISANLVTLANTMMHPQEISLESITWCEQYAPMLIDDKNVREYWDRLNRIRFEGESPDQLIGEYEYYIDEVLKASGIKDEPITLTEPMVKLAKAIVFQRNIPIDDPNSFFADPVKVKQLIELYSHEENKEEERLFKCPICRQGYVFAKEYVDGEKQTKSLYYACENEHCFVIYDNKIDEFFVGKGKALGQKERFDALKNIASKQHLKNKGYMFTDFIGRNSKPYDAKVFIDTYEDTKKRKRFTLKIQF